MLNTINSKEKNNKTFRIFLMLTALSYIVVGCASFKSLENYNNNALLQKPLAQLVENPDYKESQPAVISPAIPDRIYRSSDSSFVIDESCKIIKKFEKFAPKSYRCPGGALTVGYGFDIKRVKQRKMSKSEADRHLKRLVRDTKSFIESQLKYSKLTNNQMIALVSFVYNVGEPNFVKSDMLRLINKNKISKAAKEFNRWVYAGSKYKKKLNGLVNRRQIEKSLFTSYKYT